jgi:hypothetical protein
MGPPSYMRSVVDRFVVMRRMTVLPSVACPFLPYFATLSHKRHSLREKVIEHQMCVLIFSTILSEIFLILWRIQRDIIINVYRSACQIPVFLVRLRRNFNFLDRFSKEKKKNSNFMKIFPVGAELFQTDSQTDVTKPIPRTRLRPTN